MGLFRKRHEVVETYDGTVPDEIDSVLEELKRAAVVFTMMVEDFKANDVSDTPPAENGKGDK